MEIRKLSANEFKDVFSNPYHVFNRFEYNDLNALLKGVEINCLGFKNKKYKLGIIGVIDEGKFRSPFSAPFGGFSYAREEVSLQSIDEAIDLFIEYCSSNSIKEIELTLPPFFYDMSFLSKLSNALFRREFVLAKSDLNYSIHLPTTLEDYISTLHYNARKNLDIALTKNFRFYQCFTSEEKEMAYEVIKKNREERGFPLRLSFETILKTIDIISADFFITELDNMAVAGAMVFHVSKDIVQVVYWGDLPKYSIHKTMNYLSYSIVCHYQSTSVRIIDIGPSTENSIPNYGLCDFKESIGCEVFPKYSYTKFINL